MPLRPLCAVVVLLLCALIPAATPLAHRPPLQLVVWDLPDGVLPAVDGRLLAVQGALAVVEVPANELGSFESDLGEGGGSLRRSADGQPVTFGFVLWGERYRDAAQLPQPPDGPLRARPLDSATYIVQFAIPPAESQWQALRQGGLLPMPMALGPTTVLAVGSPQGAAALAQRGDVTAVVPYHPLWRVSPPLRSALPALGGSLTERHEVAVAFLPTDDAQEQITSWLASEQLQLQRSDSGRGWGMSGLLTLSGDQLQQLARRPELRHVSVAPIYHFTNTDATGVLQSGIDDGLATPLYAVGINGSGYVMGMADSGIDYDHLVFRDSLADQGAPSSAHRKVVSYNTSIDGWDEVGHGTHVVGTAIGDSLLTPGAPDLYDGVAFGAKVSFFDISSTAGGITPPPESTLFDAALIDGANVHSDSWTTNSAAYEIDSQAVDQYSWDHPTFLVVFAAGNEGPTVGTIESPGNAKDAISVGNALNGLTSGIDDTSSRGPSVTGAYGPLLLAPGMALSSALGDGAPGTLNEDYIAQGGTSMAAPALAGASVLVEDYFGQGFYPSGSAAPADSRLTSAPLRRALLVAAAVDQQGGTSVGTSAPNNDQGFGKVALDKVLELSGNGRDLWINDSALPGQVTALATGETISYQLSVDSGLPLVVALSYNDPAGATLIDDLDLVVTSPSGSIYHGNILLDGWSVDTTLSDTVNPNEIVRVQVPQAGQWQIEVAGRAVGVPSGGQPFALMATGEISTLADVGFDPDAVAQLSNNLTTVGGAPLQVPVQVRGPPLAGNVTLTVGEGGIDLQSVGFAPGVGPITTVSVPLTLLAGHHVLTLTLDPTNVIFEEREDNNVATLGLWVNTEPTAALLATPDPALVSDPVLLDASGSIDEGPLRYRIDPGDGTIPVWADTSSLSHTYSAVGTYVVEVTVEDNRSATASASIPLAVLDHPPEAFLAITPTESLTLDPLSIDGTGSGDPDGNATLTFDFGDGTVRPNVGPVQTYAYANDGVYTVRLTVRDQSGQEDVAVAAVTIHNRAPMLDLVDGPTSIPTGVAANFSAVASDLDGVVREIQWDFGDGSFASGGTLTHVFAHPGTSTVTVVAIDDDGTSSEPRSLLVEVLSGAPVVSILGPSGPVPTLLPVQLRSVVTDPSGGLLVFSWSWEGGSATTATATVVPRSPGPLEVTLGVTNEGGKSGRAALVIVASDRAPIPIISLLDVPVVGEPLTLSAIDSVDLDGRIVRYQWSVGTEQGAAATLTITPSAVGPLQVHLLVVDDFGLGANATLELDVRDSPPPTAKSSQRVLDASLFGPGLGLLLLLCALLGALGIALSLELLRRRTIENSPPRQRHL